MNSTYLPSSVQSILFSFRPCFSAPNFENLVALVCGSVPCQGPHTISRVIVAAAAQAPARKGHGAYDRFLSRARWSADQAGHVLLCALLPLPLFPDEIEAAVDDTLCHRMGLFGSLAHLAKKGRSAALPRARVSWRRADDSIAAVGRAPLAVRRGLVTLRGASPRGYASAEAVTKAVPA